MKKILIALLVLIPIAAISQQVVNDVNSNVKFRDTSGLGGGGTNQKAYIDITLPPYSIVANGNASLAVEQAIDSLWRTYKGGRVFIPIPVTWGRPHVGSQKGAMLRPNITVDFLGNRVTLTGNCAMFNTDFGTDSLGTTITADVDSLTTNFTVASSTGFLVGDTIYYRIQTAPYDAGEPRYFGYRIVKAIPDGTHITLDAPTGGNVTVSGTSTLNKRLIRIHNLVTNATIKNVEWYNDGGVGHAAESGVYVQGGWNIKIDNMRGTNPGNGLACFQFCVGCEITNSRLDSAANLGNANFGRGVVLNECEQCVIRNVVFNKYQSVAILNEANNPGAVVDLCTFNNNFNDSPRVAIITLGSGNMTVSNSRFIGYKHILYDAVLPYGNVYLNNTIVDRGVPFAYYESQGIITGGFLQLADTIFSRRKIYTRRFLLVPSTTLSYDSLPRGRIMRVYIATDDTTGIRELRLRRDNSFTNNTADFAPQLRSGLGILINSPQTFQVGQGIPSSSLNYNDFKGYYITTDATTGANKYVTIYVEYLENPSATLIRQNATVYDGLSVLPVLAGGTGVTTSTGTGNTVLSSAPTLTNPVVGTQSPGNNTTLGASTAFVSAAIAATGAVNAVVWVYNAVATAQTTTFTDNNYVTPNDATTHYYDVHSNAIITAISAGTLTVTVTYTDPSSTSRTATFFNQGVTAAMSVTGSSSFPPMGGIPIKANTAVTVAFTFAGVSISYVPSFTITRLL